MTQTESPVLLSDELRNIYGLVERIQKIYEEKGYDEETLAQRVAMFQAHFEHELFKKLLANNLNVIDLRPGEFGEVETHEKVLLPVPARFTDRWGGDPTNPAAAGVSSRFNQQ